MDLNNIHNYLIKLKLSDYINSRVIEVENDDGEKEKGIFIPLDINNLFVTVRNTVISWVFATQKMYDPIDNMSHYLKMKVDKSHKDKLKQLGYDPPYLGGMKETRIMTDYQIQKAKQKAKMVEISDYE